jgi:hypothetical protein
MSESKYIKIIIDGVEYDVLRTSRIENLLVEIKKAIDSGGGGGDAKPLTDDEMDELENLINNGT